ncbi:unnamed protein product [Closterium sp. NIES-53]
MTTLRVLLHIAAQGDYELHSLDFNTTLLQGNLHEEIWLCRPPGFTESFPAGTHGSLRRPVYGLHQAPREWHNTLMTTLAALGFTPLSADSSLFLRSDTYLPSFYVLMHVDDLVFATANNKFLTLVKSELQKRHTCTDMGELRSSLGVQITWDRARRTITLTQSHMVHQVLQRFGFHALGMGLILGGRSPVVLTCHADASWVDNLATQRSSQGYNFSLGSGSVSWRSTRSSSVLSSSCEVEIYAGGMAAQELRWLTYLLTNLGEQPRSPPVLYVDNKAMIALCQEHRLRTKHIALRYFLARELQQRGQLRLAYVATRANTADIFTKALQSRDHQRFTTVLGLLAFLFLTGADNSRRMNNGAKQANHLHASASVRTVVFYEGNAGQSLCCSVGTPSTCCVGRSPFCSAGTAPLRNAGRLSTMLCCPSTRLAAQLLVLRRPAAAIVTMVDPVANAGVADTLEARLADARKRHADGEYRTIPLLIVELGIRSQWATKNPTRPISPRPVRNEGGVDDEVDGGAGVSGNNGTKLRGVIKVDGGVDRSQERVQQSTTAAGSSRADVDGQRRSPLRSGGGLSATTLVTAGGIAPTYGYFKFSPDRITFALLQGQRDLITANCALGRCRATRGVSCGSFAHLHGHLEVLLTGGATGAQELLRATGCWSPGMALHPLDVPAEMRMVGAEYSTASYISHIVKGLPRSYNLMKRMMMVPGTRESLDEDSITSYILQDEAMQEAKQPTELLLQANYAAPTKLNQQQGQCRKPSGGGRSTEDVDKKRSAQDKGHGGGGRRRECWICHDPDYLSYKCPDRDDCDEDDTREGRGRSTSLRPRRDARPRKEKQTSRKTPSTKDVDNSSGKSRGDKEASCSMVGVVEPTVSLAPEAGEDFQAVAAAVQANPMAVLLDSGCSHHLMGTKAVFVDMAPSDGVKHVRGFNGELQPIEGRRTVALQGEAGKQDLIPDIIYVPSVQANLLSAGKAEGERVNTIKSSAKYNVASGLDITSSTGADPPCVFVDRSRPAVWLEITSSTGADPPCVWT